MFLDMSKINDQQMTEIKHPLTGQVVMVIHTKGGQLHRDDGPAEVHMDAEGKTWAQVWAKNGQIHRDDGPARMYLKHPQPTGKAAIDADGKHIVEWHFNGQFQSAAILDEQTFHKHWHKGDK
jgi:hypothetical protein